MKPELLELFKYFVRERFEIYLRKEELKNPFPWTEDPILREYKFCNVLRQHDRVSRWIYDNLLEKHAGDYMLPFNIVFARVCNWPDTLADVGYIREWDVGTRMWLTGKLADRVREGKKTWTSAYMVTGGGIKDPKHIIVGQIMDSAYAHLGQGLPRKITHLHQAATIFSRVRGVGDFLAAQCVADYKEFALHIAPDWWTWCAPGPGSMRGLARLRGDYLHKVYGHDMFNQEVNTIRVHLNEMMFENDWPKLDAQNTQNCLCEFDKYCRVKFNEGTRPKAKYVPARTN